ncbi:hypothetical protein, partial [Cumulibacter manganitolerans]|uniref:hypothetical protein n=1 Tax=Cumulibacter manganitolerans TaxID=1884992 RepID=UPI0018860779
RTGLRRALGVAAPQTGGPSAPSAVDDAAIHDAQAQATARTNEVRALLAEGDARSQDAARTALRARQAASRSTQHAVELGASATLGSTGVDADEIARAYAAAAEAGTVADEAHARAVAERHAATVRTAYADATAAVDPTAGAVSELARRISGVLAATVPGTLVTQSAALRGQLAAVGSEARALTDRLAALHALHDTTEGEVAAAEPSATTLESLGRQSRAIVEQLTEASSRLDARIARLGLTATVVADADRANRALASIDAARSGEAFGDYLRTTVAAVTTTDPAAAEALENARQDTAALDDATAALDSGATALTDVHNALTALADDLVAGVGPAGAEQAARAAALGAAATRHAVDSRLAADQGAARAASAYGHLTQATVLGLAALAE